jgi:hypothetical protein
MEDVFLFGFLSWTAFIVSVLMTALLGFMYIFFLRKKNEFDRTGVFLSGDGEPLNAENVINESRYVMAGLAASLVSVAINFFTFI